MYVCTYLDHLLQHIEDQLGAAAKVDTRQLHKMTIVTPASVSHAARLPLSASRLAASNRRVWFIRLTGIKSRPCRAGMRGLGLRICLHLSPAEIEIALIGRKDVCANHIVKSRMTLQVGLIEDIACGIHQQLHFVQLL